MIILNCEQGTEEWFNARLGIITASKFKDVMSKGKGVALSKTREAYLFQLVAERLTGQKEESFSSKAMDWGTETEAQAKSFYELEMGVDIYDVGFIKHNEFIGASPDGLIGDYGIIETKCPKTTTQIKRILNGEFPAEYRPQVQGQLWVSEREWCDFVSFDPRLPGSSNFFCIRVERDDVYINELSEKLYEFSDEVNELIKRIG